MAGRREIDGLQERKRTLVMESNLNRLTLQAEWRNLQAATAWVNGTARACRQLRPWLALLSPIAGFLIAHGARQPGGALNQFLSAGEWLLRLRSVWKQFSGMRAKAGPEKTAAG